MKVSRERVTRGGRTVWQLLEDAIDHFSRRGGTTVGAAVAFYALMSAAPLLVLSVSIAGLVFGEGPARQAAVGWVARQVGWDVASVLEKLMEASRSSTAGGIAAALGVVVLLWAASRLFLQLQEGLNAIWGIRLRRGDKLEDKLGKLVRKRLVSFAMVLLCGLLLGFSLAAQATLSVVANLMADVVVFEILWHLLDLVVTLGLFTALFAVLYRVLPDAKLRWRDVWVGALFTATALGLGVLLIGLYMGHVSVGSTHGAAGSLVVLVLWVYYSAMIFFFGAAFTRAWATQKGAGVTPEPHAVRVVGEDEIAESG